MVLAIDNENGRTLFLGRFRGSKCFSHWQYTAPSSHTIWIEDGNSGNRVHITRKIILTLNDKLCYFTNFFRKESALNLTVNIGEIGGKQAWRREDAKKEKAQK